jgi:hypothetical protein
MRLLLLLPLLGAGSTFIASASAAPAPAVLRNGRLRATLSPSAGLESLASLGGAGHPPPPPHTFAPGSDGWEVVVSALNTSAGQLNLSSTPSAPGVAATCKQTVRDTLVVCHAL